MTQNPESSGGGGFKFERAVIASYLVALLGEKTADGLDKRIVKRIELQQALFDKPMDDLIIYSAAPNGDEVCLDLQIKNTLTVAVKNEDFIKIITAAYKTIKKDNFKDGHDRIGVAFSKTKEKNYSSLVQICEFARNEISHSKFIKKINKKGFLNENDRRIFNIIQKILVDVINKNENIDEITYKLLKHFVCIKFDFHNESSKDEPKQINLLKEILPPDDSDRASELWLKLNDIALNGMSRAATYDRQHLREKLSGLFIFSTAISLKRDLSVLSEVARFSLDAIDNTIVGHIIPRDDLTNKMNEQLKISNFILLTGLPGTGKSAFFKEIAEKYINSSAMVILPDRISSGSTWRSYATSIGLSTHTLETILSEIATSNDNPILFIDGLDKVEKTKQGLINDLIHAILNSDLKSKWCVVATLRSNNLDYVSTWLPSQLFEMKSILIEVEPFNDEEAKKLAEFKPSLTPFLFGDERIRSIARRPFFAKIIAQAFGPEGGSIPLASTEIELLNLWWEKGGYGRQSNEIKYRQRVLIKLAKVGARSYGKRIKHLDENIDTINLLKDDDILIDIEGGRFIGFSHDIYFEWSLVNNLIEQEGQWIDIIQQIGEPPVLGRVVELLSQYYFSTSSTKWYSYLTKLEQLAIRTQWLRAWLLAPIGTVDFQNSEESYTQILLADNANKLSKCITWFQAEKTVPNIIAVHIADTLQTNYFSQSNFEDRFSWPSNISLWISCCEFLLKIIPNCPHQIFPQMLIIFEVWLMCFRETPNSLSDNILSVIKEWLEELEERRFYPESFDDKYGPWLSGDGLGDFEDRLRLLLLFSSSIAQNTVREYLVRVQQRNRLRRGVFDQIVPMAKVIAKTHGKELVNLVLKELLDTLPEPKKREERQRAKRSGRLFSSTVDHYDWERLSIHDLRGFYPSSTIHEPFASLFKDSPSEALRFVRELTGHAMIAWQQLNRLDLNRRATPIPIVINFPWGEQIFWGDGDIYCWFRGFGASNIISSALMTMEHWAFSEIEKGRELSEVLQEILEGQSCCAVLGIAIGIALAYQHISDIILPFITCQRLWHYDIYRYKRDVAWKMQGFIESKEPKYMKAREVIDSRKNRDMDIRTLAKFLMCSDNMQRTEVRTTIQDFPNKLPFGSEEDKDNPELIHLFHEQAEVWAKEYENVEEPEESRVVEQSNHIIEPTQQSTTPDTLKIFSILEWITNCLRNQVLPNQLFLSEMLAWIKTFNYDDLFQMPYDINENQLKCTAIIGIVLMNLNFSTDQNNFDWERTIIFKILSIQRSERDRAIIFHPLLYAVDALATMIKKSIDVQESQKALHKLMIHPIDEIAIKALNVSLGLWDVAPQFVWSTIKFGLMLSNSIYRHSYDMREELIVSQEESSFETSSFSSIHLSLLEPMSLEEISQSLDYHFMAQFLHNVPADKIMNNLPSRKSFLQLCDTLIKITVSSLNSIETQDRSRKIHNYQPSELRPWLMSLSKILAQVSLFTTKEYVESNFLSTILVLPDKIAISMLQPFISWFIRYSVIDAIEVTEQSKEILAILVSHIIKFIQASKKSGLSLSVELQQVVNSILFIEMEDAYGAKRFANNKWDDILLILPTIDPLIRKCSDVPFIIDSFLALCERSIEYYPISYFVEQVEDILSKKLNTTNNYADSTIPNRIAILIQVLVKRENFISIGLEQKILKLLDVLIDMGSRRAASLQKSPLFREVKIVEDETTL